MGIDFAKHYCYTGRTLVPCLDVCSMKSLFMPFHAALIVVLLTVATHAEQYVVRSDMPMSERITLRETPSYSAPNSVTTRGYVGEPVSIPVSNMVAKPPETRITAPETFTIVPFLPIQESPPVAEAPTGVMRGQAGVENLEGILSVPPSLARGTVEAGTIEPKLIEGPPGFDLEVDPRVGEVPDPPNRAKTSGQPSGITSADPVGSGVLVFATIITTLGLIYMAFIAYDYRQRWMHSLTAQNDRYIIGGTFDMDMDDVYGGSRSLSDSFGLSEGFGLARRPV